MAEIQRARTGAGIFSVKLVRCLTVLLPRLLSSFDALSQITNRFRGNEQSSRDVFRTAFDPTFHLRRSFHANLAPIFKPVDTAERS